MGATRRQLLAQGAAPARAADAPPRRQPDDPVRALDGRDRGPDRRRRARCGRHERALLEPGARDPRRDRDRHHGDGARPLDGGDRRAHRSREAAPRRQPEAAPAAASRSASSPRSLATVAVSQGARRRTRSTRTRWATARSGDARGVAAREDPGRARLRAGPDDLGLRRSPSAIGIFILQQLLLPLQEFLVEAPWFTTLGGLTAIAFVISGLRPALTTLRDARPRSGSWASGRSRWTRSRRCSWPPRSPS